MSSIIEALELAELELIRHNEEYSYSTKPEVLVALRSAKEEAKGLRNFGRMHAPLGGLRVAIKELKSALSEERAAIKKELWPGFETRIAELERERKELRVEIGALRQQRAELEKKLKAIQEAAK